MNTARTINFNQELKSPTPSQLCSVQCGADSENKTDVLFQKVANKWYAFSASGDVYFLETED